MRDADVSDLREGVAYLVELAWPPSCKYHWTEMGTDGRGKYRPDDAGECIKAEFVGGRHSYTELFQSFQDTIQCRTHGLG